MSNISAFPYSPRAFPGDGLVVLCLCSVCVICVYNCISCARSGIHPVSFHRRVCPFAAEPSSSWTMSTEKISETSWKFLFPDVCIKAETSIVQVSCLFELCPFLPCLMSRRSLNWNESLVLKLSTLIILSQSSPLKRPMKLTRSKFGAFFTNLSILLTSETPWHLDLKLPCASSS